MTKTTRKTHSFVANIGVGLLVAILIFAITGVALVRKVGTYQSSGNLVGLQVEKKEFKLVSFTTGTVQSRRAEVGQYVKKGDLLLEIDNEVRNRQIEVLKSFGKDNASAQTQLALLESQNEQQRIVAPTSGVVVRLADEGEVIFDQQNIGLIYADARMQLAASMSLEDYAAVQKVAGPITIEHKRLDKTYQVVLDGIKQDLTEGDQNGDFVRVNFSLVDPADGQNMLQNETLLLDINSLATADDRPLIKLLNVYKNLFN